MNKKQYVSAHAGMFFHLLPWNPDSQDGLFRIQRLDFGFPAQYQRTV